MIPLLQVLAVLSLAGGFVGALGSNPYWVQAIIFIASGIVSAVVFWWMAGMYQKATDAVATLREVTNSLRPMPAESPAYPFPQTSGASEGTQVAHKKYGSGFVVRETEPGSLLVRFDSGHQVVRRMDLTGL